MRPFIPLLIARQVTNLVQWTKNCFKHFKDHKQFLKGEAYESWSALKTDPTRGITVDPGYEADDDADAKALNDNAAEEKAVKIRDSLDRG